MSTDVEIRLMLSYLHNVSGVITEPSPICSLPININRTVVQQHCYLIITSEKLYLSTESARYSNESLRDASNINF